MVQALELWPSGGEYEHCLVHPTGCRGVERLPREQRWLAMYARERLYESVHTGKRLVEFLEGHLEYWKDGEVSFMVVDIRLS